MNVLFFLFFFSVAFLSNMQICLFLISLLLFLGNKNIETCRRSLLFRLFFFPEGETETNSNSKLSSVEVSPSSGLPVKNLGFLRYKLGDWVHPHDMPYNQRLQKIRGIQPPDFRITSQTMVKRIGI